MKDGRMNILTLNCIDRPGIVAAVAAALSAHDCNIEESAQFRDPLSKQFFMRVVFAPADKNAAAKFEQDFTDTAAKFDMTWSIHDTSKPLKTLVLVSKPDHCLNDLLYRWRTKNLPIEITAVASNHPDNQELVEAHKLEFYNFPLTPQTKAEQENHISDLITDTGSELVILARYMQILSPEMCTKYAGRIINIHHSFLPGFKGAKPYHQAYERGVKIIGASAHFATPDLDEGPIIKQDTVPVTHADTPEKLVRIGQDTETRVLAQAIRLYAERRIFIHGPRTVIL